MYIYVINILKNMHKTYMYIHTLREYGQDKVTVGENKVGEKDFLQDEAGQVKIRQENVSAPADLYSNT